MKNTTKLFIQILFLGFPFALNAQESKTNFIAADTVEQTRFMVDVGVSIGSDKETLIGIPILYNVAKNPYLKYTAIGNL